MPKVIPYGRQNITKDDLDAVAKALQHDFLTQGPQIGEFEENFARYVGAKYAVAVNNGTTALHLAYLSLNCGPGDTIITTPITFAATANAALYCGAKVEMADVDPNTGLIDLDVVESMLKNAPEGKYKILSPVDLAGLPVDMERCRQLADKYDLGLIEDACHAPGGSFVDSSGTLRKCGDGSLADIAIFSFHPVKHIACGEGGMVTTNDEAVAKRLRLLRSHGISKESMQEDHGGWYYEMQELGFNYRITDIQCALGNSQLKRAEQGVSRRREIAARYAQAFAGTAVKPLNLPENCNHAYHLFVVLLDNRKEVYDHLKSHSIFAQVHYSPLNFLPYFQSLGFAKGDFPNAELYYSQCLSLPMYPTLTNEEQDFVISKVLEVAQ
jgi:UDP-4-amino-4,6-dideoxy-N-acetyl-beta-L-altrosamine transaminase